MTKKETVKFVIQLIASIASAILTEESALRQACLGAIFSLIYLVE